MDEPFRCNECGKFISNKVKLTLNGLDEIIKVEGKCKIHGTQDLTNSGNWSYEDFFPEGEIK